MNKPVLIFGATTRGKIVADILQQNQCTVYGFLDNNPKLAKKTRYHLPVLGNIDDAPLVAQLVNKTFIFVALEEKEAHQRVWNMLNKAHDKLPTINAIHPSATLPIHLHIGQGNCIQAGTHINPNALVSSHCTLENNVTLGCDAVLHNFVHIGAGSIIGQQALIEENVYIGAGSLVQPHITIGKGSRIPARTHVTQNLAPNTHFTAATKSHA